MRDITKQDMGVALHGDRGSAWQRYADFFVGARGLANLLRYEIYTVCLAPARGALGLFLRKQGVPRLLGECGRGCLWGRDIELRHPHSLQAGARVAIDDGCSLDARSGIRLGDDVIIARDCILLAKTGPITLGDRCVIGAQAQISSTAGIHLGCDVGVAGQCYIGGGLYHTDRIDVPMMKQGLYTRGPVVIGDDCWIGTGVRILDGVTIGRGVSIGAGAVIADDVPDYTVVLPYQKAMRLSRLAGNEPATPATAPAATAPAATAPAATMPAAAAPAGAATNGASRERVARCVFAALQEANRQLPPDQQLAVEAGTVLYDRRTGQGFDSLGLINFVVICEQLLEEDFGRTVDLGQRTADSEAALGSVDALVEFVVARLAQ